MEIGRTFQFGRWSVQLSVLNALLWIIGAAFLGQAWLSRGFAGGNSGDLLSAGGFNVMTLWPAGSNGPGAILERHEYWRLITSVFLHGGVLHLVLNGLSFVRLGRIAEMIFGSERFLLIFLATGIAGSLASVAWFGFRGQPAVAIGASGAICGVMGAVLAHLRSRVNIEAQLWSRALVQSALITLALGFSMPGIDNGAHIGGFAAGFGLGKLLDPNGVRWRSRRSLHRPVRIVTLALVLLSVGALAVGAFGAKDRRTFVEGASRLWRLAEQARWQANHNGGSHGILEDRIAALDVAAPFLPNKEALLRFVKNVDGEREPLDFDLMIGDIAGRLATEAPDLFGGDSR